MMRDTWPDDERAAYEVAFSTASSAPYKFTNQRLDYLLPLLEAAATCPGSCVWCQEQGGEVSLREPIGHWWAKRTLDDAKRSGVRDQLAAFVQRQEEKFLVDAQGRMATKPKRGGTRKRTEKGETVYQQEFWSAMTLAELLVSRADYSRAQRGYGERIAQTDLYIAMCQTANESLGVEPDSEQASKMTPTRAQDVLGITIEDWLKRGGQAG